MDEETDPVAVRQKGEELWGPSVLGAVPNAPARPSHKEKEPVVGFYPCGHFL